MIQIQLNDKLSDTMLQGFDKKIYSLSYGQMAAIAGPEYFNQTFDRASSWQTPLYFGEAEIMILKPLANLCNSGASNLTSKLFQKACAFGLLEEIARLSSTRELAAGLSKDTIVNHPVIQQLIMMGIFDNQDSPLKNRSISQDESPTVTIQGKPADVISDITSALSGVPLKSADKSKIDVVTVMNALYSMGTIDENKDNLGNYLSDLQQTLKMGKRYPMNDSERQVYFSQLIHPVLNWLAERADKLFQGQVSLTDDSYQQWADFLIVSRWFNFYLDCVEHYDEIFPTQILPAQSQIQVVEIGNAANKFKGIYLKLAQSTMTAALTWSFTMWHNMFDFFRPFMIETHAINDLISLVESLESEYDQVKDTWADSLVKATIDRLKTISGVDLFLDNKMSTVTQIPQYIIDIMESAIPTIGDIPTGKDALTQIGKYSHMYNLSARNREAILSVLSNVASAFNSSVSAMLQATQFVTRDFKLPIRQFVLKDEVFEFSYPASTLSLVPQKATFKRADETVRTYTPWVIDNGNLKWVNIDRINTLVRLKTLNDDMTKASPSTIYWPPMDPIKVGEPYIALYAKQPVLATYTQNVTSDMLPPTWSTWFRIWATHSAETKPEHAIGMAATALAQDIKRNEGPIASCMAATCAIVVQPDGGEKRVLTPNIPWVYGVSFRDMVTANHVMDRVDMSHGPSIMWSLPLEDDLQDSDKTGLWYVDTRDLQGRLYHFCFVLWKVAPSLTDLHLPEQDSVRWSQFQLVKGSYFTVPIRRDYFAGSKYVDSENQGKSLISESDFALTDGKLTVTSTAPAYWQAVKGICPVCLTLPHLTWDMATSAQDEMSQGADIIQKLYSFLMVPVRYRYNSYDRSISFIASYDNPAVMVELRDFENEASGDKILPSQQSVIHSEFPDLTTDNGHQAPSGQDNASATQATLATAPSVSSRDNANNAVPYVRVEADEKPSQPSTVAPEPEARTEGNMKGTHAPSVSPATHASVEMTPAREPNIMSKELLDSESRSISGDPNVAFEANLNGEGTGLNTKSGSETQTEKDQKKKKKALKGQALTIVKADDDNAQMDVDKSDK